ncbi:PRC-barrel domain containing protein [Micromonospora sp. NPDC049081]|uniref:PRC-barrel domain containing protein n=1 Tax=Micromonospora sp. NPDC049081 TaxID=3155150 RepID=UPI0033F1F2A5
MRAGELLGRTAYDLHGRRLGRVVDVVVRGDFPDGRLRLTDVLVTAHWWSRTWGRLVGEQRHPSGPWAIRVAARFLSRDTRQFPTDQIQLLPPVPGFPFGDPSPPG